jgi:hypothetical protein
LRTFTPFTGKLRSVQLWTCTAISTNNWSLKSFLGCNQRTATWICSEIPCVGCAGPKLCATKLHDSAGRYQREDACHSYWLAYWGIVSSELWSKLGPQLLISIKLVSIYSCRN